LGKRARLASTLMGMSHKAERKPYRSKLYNHKD
jgi:hypothetical protein